MKKLIALLTVAAVAVPLLIAGTRMAGAELDVTGKYEPLQAPQPTETPGKIEVLEVFSYACPHCFTFLPLIEAYEKVAPDYVAVRHMPAVFNDRWAILARAYYTAKTLGVDQQIHRPLFEAIHVKNRKLDTEDDFMKFFEQFGVSNDDFKNTWSSFGVESMVRKASVMQQRYGIRGTPSIVVNGKYRVTGQLAGSYDNMIQITDALAARENAESN